MRFLNDGRYVSCPGFSTGNFSQNRTNHKSRFITSVAHTKTPEEAKQFIEKIRQEFADATHNCWAFNASAAGSTTQIGASDDGEPHGTAGKPMLTVLVHCEIGELTAVVTRYFGGTLLGTGGLVKAYQSSVRQALETLPTCEKVIVRSLKVTVEHKFLALILRALPGFRGTIKCQEFGMDVMLEIEMPEQEIEKFSSMLNNMTSGAVLIELQEEPTAD